MSRGEDTTLFRPTLAHERESIVKLKIGEVKNTLGAYVLREGWVSQEELRQYGASLEGSDLVGAWSAIMALDKDGFLTHKPGPDGEPGWAVVMAAQRSRGPNYSGFSAERPVVMRLRTAALGPLSDDNLTFHFERDDEGQIMLNAAQFKAMLKKAHMMAALLPGYDDQGNAVADPPSRDSVRRWRVRFEGVELPEAAAGAPLPVRIRRPINAQGKPVGELRHQALPPGSRLSWTVSWPTSHWSDENAALLLEAAEQVGFSPAGNGQFGGVRGVFMWVQPAPRPEASTNGTYHGEAAALAAAR